MTFGEIPADVDLKLREIVREGQGHRDYDMLVTEWKVRARHGLWMISNVKERNMFLLLVFAELNPDSPLSKWVVDNKEKLNDLCLPSPDTIFKDNREMERKGLFPKPPEIQKSKPIVQQTL